MSFSVLGTGTAVPEHSISQAEAAEIAGGLACANPEQLRRLKRLYQLTGVERRHSVVLRRSVLEGDSPDAENVVALFHDAANADDPGPGLAARMERYELEAPILAERATRRALDDAGLAPAEITHIITVTCSGFMAPGIDIHLMDTLGLPPTAQRTQVGFMGCHGAVNGMRVARGFVGSDPNAKVLLVAVELCSLHFQYGWDDERNIANALFSDGAGALILGGAAAPSEAWRATHTGSCLLPDSRDAMSWRIRDHGFVMTLSDEVPKKINDSLAPWLDTWLAARALTQADIKTWAVHPGGPAILRAVQKSLGLHRKDLADSWETLREFGNMSSPTLLFILQKLQARNAPRPCVALGFGPGLVVEAILFE